MHPVRGCPVHRGEESLLRPRSLFVSGASTQLVVSWGTLHVSWSNFLSPSKLEVYVLYLENSGQECLSKLVVLSLHLLLLTWVWPQLAGMEKSEMKREMSVCEGVCMSACVCVCVYVYVYYGIIRMCEIGKN